MLHRAYPWGQHRKCSISQSNIHPSDYQDFVPRNVPAHAQRGYKRNWNKLGSNGWHLLCCHWAEGFDTSTWDISDKLRSILNKNWSLLRTSSRTCLGIARYRSLAVCTEGGTIEKKCCAILILTVTTVHNAHTFSQLFFWRSGGFVMAHEAKSNYTR